MILDPTSCDEEGKKSIYVIIGVCCGVFLLILVVVYMIRYCKRRLRHDSCHVTDRMPNDNSFSNNENMNCKIRKKILLAARRLQYRLLALTMRNITPREKKITIQKKILTTKK